MQLALHVTTKVLPGNKIEIEIPEGEIGDTVDVFVVLPGKPKEKKRSVMETLVLPLRNKDELLKKAIITAIAKYKQKSPQTG